MKKRSKKKICNRCHRELYLTDFYVSNKHKDGFLQPCKECESKRGKLRRKNPKHKKYHRDYIKAWRKRTGKDYPDKREGHARNLMVKFKLTVADFDKMVVKQNNCCAICKRKFTWKICVDHDHNTGEVRQLLCHFCNCGLGHFNDSVKILKRAIKYLEKYK